MAELRKVSLPRRVYHSTESYIPGPSHEAFVSRFGDAFPKPSLLESDLGMTAVYDLPASKEPTRQVLLVHGMNTPAIGMLPLARELQALDSHIHIVLFDLWGHGLSSTPLVPHTPQIFHSQILQVLAYMHWTTADIIGFSFGGILTATFATYNPRTASSVALVAPAGIIRKTDLGAETRELLEGEGRDEEAVQAILNWLGANSQALPDRWQEEMRSGKVNPKALKQWELEEHRGYRYSVLSAMRDGWIFERDEDIRRFAKLPTKKVVVLGEIDDVCDKQQLEALGVSRVEVIEKADHEVVRSRAADIAKIIYDFWA